MAAELPEDLSAPQGSWALLFEHLPIGAYQSLPNGRQLRANPALVRLNGYDNEADMLAAVGDIGREWYVDPARRQDFMAVLERDGQVLGMVSEIYRHRSRERIWISENAYVVRDAGGRPLRYEGTVEEVTDRVQAVQSLEHREALLRDITAGVPGVVYRMQVFADGSRRYEFISEGVRALYGVAPQDVLADPMLLSRLRHPDDLAWVEATMREHLISGEPASVEFRIQPPGQAQKWVRLSSSLAPGDDGSFRLHGVVIDITAARDAEQALLDSNRRWKAALDCLGDGVWDWNLMQDDCVMTGPLSEGFDQPVGSPCEGLCEPGGVIHPDDLPDMLATRQAHIDRVTPTYEHEHRIRQRDGSWLWVLSRGVVVERDAQGQALRMVGTHTDISERREADALRQQRDRAEAADRTKSELMSRISHELRTPLNAILGYAQLLEVDTAPGSVHHEWAGHALTSGRLLLGLVDDVLDLTQGQSMQFTLAPEPVSLQEAFTACWPMLTAQAAAQQVTLSTPPVDAGLRVLADAKRLRQVLSNLLSNAIKYNRSGGMIAFDARRDGDAILFQVRDSGRGIAAEYLPRVFQPFDRLGAAHGKVAGTGLGLALSKQLVEVMGGTIAVDSEAEVGTTFTVRLPAAD